ncbi:MAG TPA: hypothetical protein VMU36_08140 [Spirochaetia bacterium]|nr:hypothetical protein [Spirochaetia bacterium]
MKTTVDLPDDLLIRAKKRAAETRTPLRVLIERGLRRELAGQGRARSPRAPRKVTWIVAPGGLPPGLDVSDRSSLVPWIGSEK